MMCWLSSGHENTKNTQLGWVRSLGSCATKPGSLIRMMQLPAPAKCKASTIPMCIRPCSWSLGAAVSLVSMLPTAVGVSFTQNALLGAGAVGSELEGAGPVTDSKQKRIQRPQEHDNSRRHAVASSQLAARNALQAVTMTQDYAKSVTPRRARRRRNATMRETSKP